MHTTIVTALIALGIGLSVTAIADPHAHHGHHATAATDSAAAKAFSEVNKKMHDDMNIELTGDADVDFMRGMIPHHRGAVEMAKIVLEHGKDPEVRKLAEDVIE